MATLPICHDSQLRDNNTSGTTGQKRPGLGGWDEGRGNMKHILLHVNLSLVQFPSLSQNIYMWNWVKWNNRTSLARFHLLIIAEQSATLAKQNQTTANCWWSCWRIRMTKKKKILSSCWHFLGNLINHSPAHRQNISNTEATKTSHSQAKQSKSQTKYVVLVVWMVIYWSVLHSTFVLDLNSN